MSGESKSIWFSAQVGDEDSLVMFSIIRVFCQAFSSTMLFLLVKRQGTSEMSPTSQLLPWASLPCAAFSASLPIQTPAGLVPVVSVVGQDREGPFGFGFIESEVSNE